jgi:hypothetical protein
MMKFPSVGEGSIRRPYVNLRKFCDWCKRFGFGVKPKPMEQRWIRQRVHP